MVVQGKASVISIMPPDDNTVKYVQAYKYSLDQGVARSKRTPRPMAFHMDADKKMYADIMECMPRAIASSIKILFIIQAQPHPDRCLLLSVTKLTSVPASYSRVKISFLINTCQMMVSISPSKQVESLTLLNMYVPKLFFFLIRIHVPSGNPHTSLHYMILGRYQLSSRMHSIKVILRLNASHPFSQMGPNHCDPGLRRSVDPTRYGILLPNEVRTGTVELPSQDFLIKGHVNRRHHHA